MSYIFFVGPLPPPLHGFSKISESMLHALQCQYDVAIFDTKIGYSSFSFLFTWFRFVSSLIRHKPISIYLALSGGRKQWLDLVFALVGVLRGVPIFVHHHSFAYLNIRKFSTMAIFGLLRNATHIVLCDCMATLVMKQYSVDPKKLRVLSNAAFLPRVDITTPLNLIMPVRSSLRIGFLSNITTEKGIFEFFSVLGEASKSSLNFCGVIAGPVGPSIKQAFDATLSSSTNVEYIGSVYGDDKVKFFEKIDLLFFPTKYANEAEPVTIWESLGFGVPVVAFERGCIRDMVPKMAGVTFEYSSSFIPQTIAAFRAFAEDRELLMDARLAAMHGFEASRSTGKVALDDLLLEIGCKFVSMRPSQ